jgi:hypothetical protein
MSSLDLFAPERVTTARLVAGILDAVSRGLAEEGMPLTAEQQAFLDYAADGPLR